jgi:hypothetical protein
VAGKRLLLLSLALLLALTVGCSKSGRQRVKAIRVVACLRAWR